MKKIYVTGGSGKAGKWVVLDLIENGFDVEVLDLAAPTDASLPFTQVDLTDYGQTIDALGGTDCRLENADAIVHLAAIPGPGRKPDAITFETNMTSTYNVFRAATKLGLKRIVWASSETTLGLPFDTPPDYVPVDEDTELRPEWSYSLSKVLSEEMAKYFSRWHPEIPIIGLRLSNVLDENDYKAFPGYWLDPLERKWNLWGYVDVHDVAQSVRLSLTASVSGARNYIIAAADTVMNRPNKELMAEVFPGVPMRAGCDEFQTLLAIDKAREELGYRPGYSWRDYL
jgi:nucleoside-diphosphate-sugar epimerase